MALRRGFMRWKRSNDERVRDDGRGKTFGAAGAVGALTNAVDTKRVRARRRREVMRCRRLDVLWGVSPTSVFKFCSGAGSAEGESERLRVGDCDLGERAQTYGASRVSLAACGCDSLTWLAKRMDDSGEATLMQVW